MSEWRDLRLGDVLEPVDERVREQSIDLVLSVTEKRGVIPQTEVFTKRVAVADVSKYKVLRPMDLAYNPYLLWAGAVGQWLGDEPGVTSPVYECFRAKQPHVPRFIGLLLESGLLTPYFDSTAVGSIQRRRRTTPKVFLEAQVSMPELDTQRQIVDLVSALDTLLARERESVGEARTLLWAFLAEHFGSVAGPMHRIVDLCEHVIGGVWGGEAGTDEVDVLALGPRIYSPGTPGFSPVGSPTRSFSSRQVESRRVRAHDIVLERSGGSPEQPVGRVVIATGAEAACVPTDFQRLLRADPSRVLPRYLFWRLWADWRGGKTLGFSRRTTGITNLSVRDYLSRSIVVPTQAEQHRVVQFADSIAAVVEAGADCATRLSGLRPRLLNDLLTGDVVIANAYDGMLAQAV